MAKEKITYERLRELLHYDPETGVWTALSLRRGPTRECVGCVTLKGYLSIRVEWRAYQAHVLAWFYMTGEWPDDEIDHWDTDKLNNRWGNLRKADHSQNNWNRPKYANNTSGRKGVTWHKYVKKWQAQINVDGKRHTIGYFDTVEAAHEAYIIKAQQIYGEYARG